MHNNDRFYQVMAAIVLIWCMLILSTALAGIGYWLIVR